MSRYISRSGEHGIQDERDRQSYRLDAERQRQERFAGPCAPEPSLREALREPGNDGRHSFSREQIAARLPLFAAFAAGKPVYRLESRHGRFRWVNIGDQATFQGPLENYSLDPDRPFFSAPNDPKLSNDQQPK